jgi:zinc protease
MTRLEFPRPVRTILRLILGVVAPVGLVLALAATAPRAAPEPVDVTHFVLDNGLEVIVIPDHRVPVVTQMVWYRVGSADEPPGKSGIAHFLEHLMFKGTEKNPAGKFSQVLATIGGQENAFTTADYTGYYQRVAREYLPLVMEFEADRMTGLVLTEANVRPELDVVLEEHNMRVANNPDARLREQVEAALFVNHPYGRPVIGWRPEIEKLSREDALAFYRRFYTPNNAVVVVAGDVTADEVRALAAKTYGKVARRGEIGARTRPQEPAPTAMRQVTLADSRAQPSLQRAYLAPSDANGKPGEPEALDVLAHILGGGSNSRLHRKLVEDRGVANSAGASYSGTAVDNTVFSIYATPRPHVSLSKLEADVDDVIDEVASNGVTPEELERAKTRMIADAVYAKDNQATLARWYGSALATGRTVAHVNGWTERVRAVTADSVRAAARTWLDKHGSVTGYLIREWPKPEEKKS